MKKEDLKERTKQYALRVIALTRALPDNQTNWVIGKQLLRSGTSVGANYRAACRGRSTTEFIAKLGIVIEEIDESAFWLEIIIEAGIYKKEMIEPLLAETNELVAIMVSSSNTARKNNKK
jgi:four helix bundle protein